MPLPASFLPVLSLAHEREAYEQMGRLDTAVLLQQWLEIPTEIIKDGTLVDRLWYGLLLAKWQINER